MAELYRPDSRRPPAQTNDLPGLGRLSEDERAQIAFKQIEAAVTKLGDVVSAAGLPALDVGPFASYLTPGTNPLDREQALLKLHVELLSTLTAADFRLGKAYGLGRALADTCRNPADAKTLQDEFSRHRIATLQTWLHDLASVLPAHAGHSVADSLERWVQAVTPTNGQADPDPTQQPNPPKHPIEPEAQPDRVKESTQSRADPTEDPAQQTNPTKEPASGQTYLPKDRADPLLAVLPRQGQLWRSLLSAEKAAADMLEIGEYVDAATRLLRTARRLARRFVVRSPLLVALIVVLFGGGVFLMLNQTTSASIVAGAGGILASVGITWKSVGAALGGIGAKVEQQLWGAELDTAVADAITLASTSSSTTQDAPHPPLVKRLLTQDQIERMGRLEARVKLAKAARWTSAGAEPPGPAPPVGSPHAQLLHPVLDPEVLLEKLNGIGGLRERQVTHGAELAQLPPEHRLPPGHLDQLSADIQAEKNDPNRVTRAQGAPGAVGPPAPPPVIYLSRKPTVSQFMSVITQCIEAELQGPALQRLGHLSHLDQLWRDVERFSEDLRSRFRRFGPCDIRFVEPKLAQVYASFNGKHAFATDPPEVRLGENAKVIVLGDWATGLPQACNVAARIREQITALEPGKECHVIHLGDTYYSGLEDECRRRFLDMWPVPNPQQANSWTLAGNHDMYAGGHGYFDVLLADARFATQKRCSYFALANDHWQILGLDSSYKDADVPDLQDPQGDWLAGRVRDAGARRTILLTHHQPFSAYEQVDSPLAGAVAAALNGVIVDAWLWGHEHRCAVYEPDVVAERYQANARYTAVVGHGGVPNLVSAQSPGKDADAIKWEFADYYEVGDDQWGLGGFAVLEFDGPKLEIRYCDEYGKTARDGALGYSAEEASVAQVRAADDPRHERPLDVLGV